MGKRGTIGFIAANPEDIFQQRMMDGIFDQCSKYGFDCAVFSPMVKANLFFKEYLDGELNIFELINFDKLAGVIVASFSLTEGDIVWIKDYVAELLQRKCNKPVISLGLPLGDYPMLCTADRESFVEITDHLIDVHGCRKMLFLAGMRDNTASVERFGGFKDSMEKHGLTVSEDDLIYGDFWYTSGEALAESIISGKREKPDAVVCANDYMAIGLVNCLAEHGIKVPADIIVTGFDAVPETVMNNITVTSSMPAAASTAA